MPDTLYERYNTDDNSSVYCYDIYWKGQSFTIGNTGANVSHKLTSIILRAFRVGNPGTWTLIIRDVDGGGKPTGPNLSTGTINANDFGTVSPGDWEEVAMSSFMLQFGKQYALCTNAEGADITNAVRWCYDSAGALYGGGVRLTSNDDDVTWNLDANGDMMFEEYGIPGYFVTLADTMGLAEVIKFDIGAAHADTINLSESEVLLSAFQLALADTETLSETIAHDITMVLADTINLSEDEVVDMTTYIKKMVKAALVRKLGMPTPHNIGPGL